MNAPSAVPSTPPVLRAHVRRFAYDGATPVLRDVRLSLGAGSLTAVLGASGSGTSTLARILSGWALADGTAALDGSLEAALADRGAVTLEFDGTGAGPRLSLGAWGTHVAYVPQRASDLFTLAATTVAEEIAYSLEQWGVPRPQMAARVHGAAAAVGLEAHLDRHPLRLSGGEQRRLALACAIVGRPAVLLLDQPGASLDAAGQESLARLVAEVRSAGTAVVLFGSCADPLAEAAEKWTVLADGRIAAAGAPDSVRRLPAFRASGVVASGAAGAASSLPPRPSPGGPLRAELDRVAFAYPDRRDAVLVEAELAVTAGEVIAVTGPNGAGKSTLLGHLAGLRRPCSGTVRIDGRDVARLSVGEIARSVGTLFQDPRDQLFERTAVREVAYGLRALGLTGREARERALASLADVGLSQAADMHPYELSGSGQRLLALASVLAREPRLLLLDEPTVGLDSTGLSRLEAAVHRAARRGAAVVLTTHAVPWAVRNAHRVLQVRGGGLVPVEGTAVR